MSKDETWVQRGEREINDFGKLLRRRRWVAMVILGILALFIGWKADWFHKAQIESFSSSRHGEMIGSTLAILSGGQASVTGKNVVISSGNQGTIINGDILGDVPRKLTDRQKSIILPFLKNGVTGKVIVMPVPDPEATNYAKELFDLFVAAGYTTNVEWGSIQSTALLPGLSAVFDGDFDSRTFAGGIQFAMAQAGITLPFSKGQMGGMTNSLHLIIGPKPR